MKLSWGIWKNQSALWVRVLLNKYGGLSDNNATISLGHNPSNIWKGIYTVWPEVLNNVSFRIKDGAQARFWINPWVPNFANLEDYALWKSQRMKR